MSLDEIQFLLEGKAYVIWRRSLLPRFCVDKHFYNAPIDIPQSGGTPNRGDEQLIGIARVKLHACDRVSSTILNRKHSMYIQCYSREIGIYKTFNRQEVMAQRK